MDDDKCYWIAIPGRVGRANCCGKYEYLSESMYDPENESLAKYVGKPCPFCGKPIVIDEHSYSLLETDS